MKKPGLKIPYPKVEIEWTDAFSVDKWIAVEELQKMIDDHVRTMPAEHAGLYKVAENKDWVAVSGCVAYDYADDNPLEKVWRVACTMCIPRRWIKHIRRLK